MYKLNIKSPVTIAVALLLISVIVSVAVTVNHTSNDNTAAVQSVSGVTADNFKPKYGEYYEHKGEMRAVWISYLSLTMDKNNTSQEAFEEKFDKLIETAVNHKMNTVIVHVIPFADAMYPSEYYPWSHLITGKQGQNPGFDPLKYMVDAAHAAKLEFHAWINPLRLQKDETPNEFSDNSLYNKWYNKEKTKDYIVKYDNGYYLNPAVPQVRNTIISVVGEIVKNYAVDGIHFDDYFYPTQDDSFDKSCYEDYLKNLDDECTPQPLLQWRKGNINMLISGVYSRIHTISNRVKFGISPQCNVENDINMGADVYSWCSTTGYIDYICPQMYVNFENSSLPFDTATQQWKNIVTNKNIMLYAGLAVYKAGSDKDDGTWQKSNDILKKEIEYCRSSGGINGFMLYDIDYLSKAETKEEVENVMAVLQ